jgi:hypothetical protein
MKFDTLSDKAKEKARDWWRCCEMHDLDLSNVIEDFIDRWKKIGLIVDYNDVRWSGFCSQGDGASFAGTYYPKEDACMWAAEWPKLLSAARTLESIQRRHNCEVSASISIVSGHYVHSNMMRVDTYLDDEEEYNEGTLELDEEIRDVMRGLADELWCALEEEYDWIMGDENVDENIRANEYDFDEDGSLERGGPPPD